MSKNNIPLLAAEVNRSDRLYFTVSKLDPSVDPHWGHPAGRAFLTDHAYTACRMQGGNYHLVGAWDLAPWVRRVYEASERLWTMERYCDDDPSDLRAAVAAAKSDFMCRCYDAQLPYPTIFDQLLPYVHAGRRFLIREFPDSWIIVEAP